MKNTLFYRVTRHFSRVRRRWHALFVPVFACRNVNSEGETDEECKDTAYCVIEPTSIREMDVPEFDESHYLSEDEYRTYLEAVQPLIEEYDQTGTIHSIEYLALEDVARYSEENSFIYNFRCSFLTAGDHVKVKKCQDGTYAVTSNGRHRMYIAKKYGLKLLVYVGEGE